MCGILLLTDIKKCDHVLIGVLLAGHLHYDSIYWAWPIQWALTIHMSFSALIYFKGHNNFKQLKIESCISLQVLIQSSGDPQRSALVFCSFISWSTAHCFWSPSEQNHVQLGYKNTVRKRQQRSMKKLWIRSESCLVYNKNRSGPSTDPCGAPQRRGISAEMDLLCVPFGPF